MENHSIRKILVIEDRVVGFFSNVLVIIGALARLSQLGITKDRYSFKWNNQLYQSDDENLFDKYLFKNHDDTSCTHSIKAIDLQLPNEFFLTDARRTLLHETLEANSYFSNSIYKSLKVNSPVLGRTLGLHVRGMDHSQHGEILNIHLILEHVDNELKSQDYSSIFIATDEEKIIKLFSQRYGGILTYNHNITRSSTNNAIHFSNHQDKEKLAMDVLLDSISLSLCSKILITSSNVSGFSLILNKDLNYKYMDKHISYS